MGWHVTLRDKDGDIVRVPLFAEGSKIPLHRDSQWGGDTASIEVTYNYKEVLDAVLGADLATSLHGKKASDTHALLLCASSEFRSASFNRMAHSYARIFFKQDKHTGFELGGYWIPTPENVLNIVSLLYSWSKEHPEAVWAVTLV